MAYDDEQIQTLVHQTGFPVLIRPSYVIGGKGMEIINNGNGTGNLFTKQ